MKVFVFDTGEQEYIAANSIKEAKEIYIKTIEENDFSDFEISEYPTEKWSKFIIDYPDENPAWQETLERKMERVKEPEYLCSSVY